MYVRQPTMRTRDMQKDIQEEIFKQTRRGVDRVGAAGKKQATHSDAFYKRISISSCFRVCNAK